jgi:hypothetical protein
MEVMNKWSLYKGSNTDWRNQLIHLEGVSYLHEDEWASHLEGIGWTVRRWHYQDGERTALLQGFMRQYPFGVAVLWFPDWIIGDYALSKGIGEVLRKSLGLRFLYIRIRSHRLSNCKKAEEIQSFERPNKVLNSGLTMHLDLQPSEQDLHKKLTKNWRHNLKRSNKLKYDICNIVDANTIIQLYSELILAKGLKGLFSPDEIRGLMNVYGDKLIVIGAITPDGVVQAVRGAIIVGDQAIDIFAAANLFSRKHYLSYSLCWSLLLHCKLKGCINYNFNGVDPKNNMGVYNFKKGTGAKLVETLGEFEWSNIFLMKWLVGFVSKWRR